MLTSPLQKYYPPQEKGGILMPATITSKGYIRVVHQGFDKTLIAWRNHKLSEDSETAKMLCDLFNQLILMGNFRPTEWFPKERAKFLLKNICWTWLYHKAKRPATIEDQTYILKKYIIPQVGNKSIQELTRQDFYWIRGNHGDTQMANDIRSVAGAILNWAWKEGITDRQLFLPVISVPKKPTPYIELNDRWRIYDKIDSEYQDPVLLSIEMGMRVGEIVAIKWDCVDLENGILKIIRTLSGGHIVDMRKGGDEIWLLMTDKVKAMLERRRKVLDSHWVFVGKKGNHLWTNYVSNAFKRAARECGLPHARLHDCRHSIAIDDGLAGESLEYTQERLGHRERKTTEKYRGMMAVRRLTAATKMEKQI